MDTTCQKHLLAKQHPTRHVVMATPWVEGSKTGCTSISGTTVELFTYTELVYKHAYTAKNYLVNSEVSKCKKQHLMIFIRALLTITIGQCQVKA